MTCPNCNSRGEPIGNVYIDIGIEDVAHFINSRLNGPEAYYRHDLRTIMNLINNHVGIQDQLDEHAEFYELPVLGIQMRADQRGVLLAPMGNDSDDDDDDNDEVVEVIEISDDEPPSDPNRPIEIDDDSDSD